MTTKEENVHIPKTERLRELHLFCGAGGGVLGGLLLGHRPVCAVEIEPYPRQVLLQRQRDGILPRFPIWDDIRTFGGKPWKGKVDVVCGGFPCQDLSIAGKGTGLEGERSGLWGEMARVIGEVQPRIVFVENSPMLVVRGLQRVIGNLSELGYRSKWGVLGGFSIGSCTNRKRLWILASRTDSIRFVRPEISFEKSSALASSKRQFERAVSATIQEKDHTERYRDPVELANGMDRLKAIGNGQNPYLAATIWRILSRLIGL